MRSQVEEQNLHPTKFLIIQKQHSLKKGDWGYSDGFFFFFLFSSFLFFFITAEPKYMLACLLEPYNPPRFSLPNSK